MRNLFVAFDVDDTLIVPAVATGFDRDTPNYATIAVYRWFQSNGHTMIIWSGGGAQYAQDWANRLGLTADYYLDKHDPAIVHPDGVLLAPIIPDIAFDDSDIALATVNVKVLRENNQVVRYPDRVRRANA